MANRVAALLVMCIVVAAAVQFLEAAAGRRPFIPGECYKICDAKCKARGEIQPESCELGCGGDCFIYDEYMKEGKIQPLPYWMEEAPAPAPAPGPK